MTGPVVQFIGPQLGTRLPGAPAAKREAAAQSWERELGLARSQLDSQLSPRDGTSSPGSGRAHDQRADSAQKTETHGVHTMQQVVAFLEGLADVRIDPVPANVLVPAAQPWACADASGPHGSGAIQQESSSVLRQTLLPRADSTGCASAAHPESQLATRIADTREMKRTATHVCIGHPVQASTPLRVHADWSLEGVRIWLGVAAAESGSGMAIAGHLQRWLGAQGVRVLSITCNGKALFEHHVVPGGPAPHDAQASPPEPIRSGQDKEQT